MKKWLATGCLGVALLPSTAANAAGIYRDVPITPVIRVPISFVGGG